ncbi:MAG: hypothetical protein LBU10_05805 [Endomicrobium sp.]|jgi:hypothetical protein|nr:hypothetical protein [Endomicrobium sp.]
MVTFLEGKKVYEKVVVNEVILSGADQNLAVSKYFRKVLDTEVYGIKNRWDNFK